MLLRKTKMPFGHKKTATNDVRRANKDMIDIQHTRNSIA